MAEVKINPAAAVLNDKAAITFTAIDATDGAYVNYADAVDTRIAIVLQNTSTTTDATVVLKKGDGIQAVDDVSVSVAKSTSAVVVLDSGSFKILSGTYKGYVHLTGPAAVNVAPIKLP